jgi:hypothetical protein
MPLANKLHQGNPKNNDALVISQHLPGGRPYLIIHQMLRMEDLTDYPLPEKSR